MIYLIPKRPKKFTNKGRIGKMNIGKKSSGDCNKRRNVLRLFHFLCFFSVRQ